MLKTIGQYVNEVKNEDLTPYIKQVGISEAEYRIVRHKPVVLASTEPELNLIKLVDSIQFHTKTGSFMNESFFKYKNEIYPKIKLCLVNAIKFGFLKDFDYIFLVNNTFSPKFLTELLEEIALENKIYDVTVIYSEMDTSLYSAFAADMERCLFDVLDLKEGFAVLNYIQDNFNPIFYNQTLMHYIAEKHHA